MRAARWMVGILLSSTAAHADVSKEQCVDANVDAQSLRRAGKLHDARAQLELCGRPSCPALVRSDCLKRLDELERAQPAIVIQAKDDSGADLGAVRVAVDGTLLTDKLDGKPLRVDPGEHVFVFEAPGRSPLTRTWIINEGDKDRRERIVLGGDATAARDALPTTGGAAPAAARPLAPEDGASPRRTLAFVVGGLGVAGLAAGSVFGLMASSRLDSQRSNCESPTSCPNRAQALEDHDAMSTNATLSTIGFVAGGALLVGGVVLLVTAGGRRSPSRTSALVVSPALGPSTAGLSAGGRF